MKLTRSNVIAVAGFAGLGLVLWLIAQFIAPKNPPVVEIPLSGGQMILAFVGVLAIGFALGRRWPQ